ncbi:hypothetical protein S245_052636, partial [Arachis hypogaea]
TATPPIVALLLIDRNSQSLSLQTAMARFSLSRSSERCSHPRAPARCSPPWVSARCSPPRTLLHGSPSSYLGSKYRPVSPSPLRKACLAFSSSRNPSPSPVFTSSPVSPSPLRKGCNPPPPPLLIASILKAVLRYGKKQFAVDETRRDTRELSTSILKALLRYGKKQFAVDETR